MINSGQNIFLFHNKLLNCCILKLRLTEKSNTKINLKPAAR